MTHSSGLFDHPAGLRTDVLRSMLGCRITRVRYKTSVGLHRATGQHDRVITHDVDHAVVVETDSMAMVLEWQIRNYAEFLSVAGSVDESAAAAVADSLDVSTSPGWSRLVGSVVTGFGLATQTSEEGEQLLWSLRLDAENGISVVVALGETEQDLPRYQADNLVVIFESEVAKSYEVPGAHEAAWGRDLYLQ